MSSHRILASTEHPQQQKNDDRSDGGVEDLGKYPAAQGDTEH